MRLLRRTTVILVLCGAGAGCSLLADFSDLAGPARATVEAGTLDGANDPGKDATSADVVTTVDASTKDAAPCLAASSIANGFDAGVGTFVPFSTLSGYPNTESFFGTNATVLFPFRDTSYVNAGPDADPEAGPVQNQQEFANKHSGLWLPNPLPVTAFDVSFDANVVCTSASSCADGLIFAWLDLANTMPLVNTLSGGTAGLPAVANGAAFVIDDYKNDPGEMNDPYAPSLQIVQLDATKQLPDYAWQVGVAHSTFPGAWHSYTVKLRGNTVTATIDGAAGVAGQVKPIANAIVGFTAGVGGESDAVALRNFSATFYDCTPP